MLGGARGFNELQRGLPGISRSVLTDRIRALERAEVIERRTAPLPALIAYGSPITAIRALHHSGRNRHACIRVQAGISADRRLLLPRTMGRHLG
jgi:DNA-binding Lrp family transcriptional regulator